MSSFRHPPSPFLGPITLKIALFCQGVSTFLQIQLISEAKLSNYALDQS